MALKRPMISPYDGTTIPNCHHKVTRVDWSVEHDQIDVTVRSYMSKVDANAERNCIVKRIFYGNNESVFLTSGNPLNRIYDWLKTLPEFSEAIDD